MDNDLFDAVARSVATRLPRRTMAGFLAGGGLAATLSGAALAKKKKKKKKTKCLAPGKNCGSDSACCSKNCCGGECMFNGRICCTSFSGGSFHCSDENVCCDPETSNTEGCTVPGFPVCCGTPGNVVGHPTGHIC